jgi:hypothetical protein
LRGYKKIILKKEGEEEDWAKNEWEILNELAYAELLIGCQDDRCFGIIDGARSTMFPEGDSKLAWKLLNERFEPKNSSNLGVQSLLFEEGSRPRRLDPEAAHDEQEVGRDGIWNDRDGGGNPCAQQPTQGV